MLLDVHICNQAFFILADHSGCIILCYGWILLGILFYHAHSAVRYFVCCVLFFFRSSTVFYRPQKTNLLGDLRSTSSLALMCTPHWSKAEGFFIVTLSFSSSSTFLFALLLSHVSRTVVWYVSFTIWILQLIKFGLIKLSDFWLAFFVI